MAVGGGEVAVALDELRASGAAAGPARLALHVGEGGSDGLAVGGLDFEGGNRAAKAPEQGDRLGGREGEVEAGDRAIAADPAHREQGLAVDRVLAGQHRDELFLADLALQTEVAGGVADPLPRRLALAGVVVLGAFGDLVEVVALLAAAELCDREHLPALSERRARCIGSSRHRLLCRRSGLGVPLNHGSDVA